MRFRVTFKDPDTLHDCIREAVEEEVAKLSLPKDEADELVEIRCAKIEEWACRWFRYGEYVDLECDSESDSVVVIKR